MKPLRVALVIPPGLAGTTPNREGAAGLGTCEPEEGGFVYPPHTVASVASALTKSGYYVTALDAPGAGMDVRRAVEALVETDAGLIGVQVSWATLEADRQFLGALRSGGIGAPIVVFGPATAFLESAVAGPRCVLVGEPEAAFVALCRRWDRNLGALPQQVAAADLAPGLYDEHNLLRSLEELPYPAWDILPWRRYPFLTILSSRGCDHSCAWCPYVVAQGHGYRACTPERTVAELAWMIERFSPRRIVFRDPVFALDGGRAAEICRLVLRTRTLRNHHLAWECESRPEHFSPRLLRLMSLAGCAGIKVGLESADPALLVRLGRLASVEQAPGYLSHVAWLARECAKLGISFRLFAMVGLPGQSEESVSATEDFLGRLPGPPASIKSYVPYPGTGLYGADLTSGARVADQARLLKDVQGGSINAASSAARWKRSLRRKYLQTLWRLGRL